MSVSTLLRSLLPKEKAPPFCRGRRPRWGRESAPRSAAGFTVVEIVIASAILLVVVMATMTSIAFASQSAQMSERRSEALAIANQQIEFARNLSFDDIATVVPANGLPAGKIPGSQTIGAYTVNTAVSYGTYQASSAARYKSMTVTVSWSSPTSGSVTLSTLIAGASGTQDYNFGTVVLSVTDESGSKVSGVQVILTDANSRSYSVVTTSTGTAEFDYVPAGAVTCTATKCGVLIDSAGTSLTCTANQVTTYAVTAHTPHAGSIKVLASSGKLLSGIVVALSGPTSPPSQTTDANGVVTFTSLIAGTYTVATTANTYYAAYSGSLTISGADTSVNATLTTNPATVTATRSSSGTIYLWSASKSLIGSAVASGSKSSYKATFTITNPDDSSVTYYFTKTNTFATTNPLVVTAGGTLSVTVN